MTYQEWLEIKRPPKNLEELLVVGNKIVLRESKDWWVDLLSTLDPGEHAFKYLEILKASETRVKVNPKVHLVSALGYYFNFESHQEDMGVPIESYAIWSLEEILCNFESK